MSEEIKPWDPEDAISAIRERIRSEFVQMIPPEQFTEMVRSVISKYTEKKDVYSNNRERVSDFDRTVEAELQTATKAEVKKLLDSPEWASHWDGQKHVASDKIKEILTARGPDILNKWLESAFQQALSSIQFLRQ